MDKLSKTLLSGFNGKAHAIMVVANEVTAQVEARKLAEDVSERYVLALNAGKLGSYDLDLATGKMECSDQCKSNFGLQTQDRLDFVDLFKDYVQGQVQTALSQNQIYEAEYEIPKQT